MKNSYMANEYGDFQWDSLKLANENEEMLARYWLQNLIGALQQDGCCVFQFPGPSV